MATMAFVIGGDRVRWSKNIWPYAFLGAIGLLAASLYIRGLENLTVAEATVIVFVSPLIVTACSAFFFREHVVWQKWLSVIVSFSGVMIAIRPGTEAFKPASLFILASATLYATMSLSARWIQQEDNIWSIGFFGSAFSALYVAPLTIGHWGSFHADDIALFVGAALCSSFAVGLSTLAYRSAPASDLSPFAYSGLIWSAAVTWLVWGVTPESWTLMGAIVIASSSVFQLWSRSQK